MRHLGNMTVTAENAQSFPAVDEFYGHLTIAANADLTATRLMHVRGWVTVHGKLRAPLLGGIDGWLTLKDGSFCDTPNLLRVTDAMTLGDASFPAEGLTHAGSINVLRGGDYGLPALAEVRDSITLGPGASLGAPKLTRLGRSLTLREKAWFGAPELAHIGGYADIDESATIIAPKFVGA